MASSMLRPAISRAAEADKSSHKDAPLYGGTTQATLLSEAVLEARSSTWGIHVLKMVMLMLMVMVQAAGPKLMSMKL